MKIYFLQRPMHRKRQRETVEFCPEGIEPMTPTGITFTQDTAIRAQYRAGRLRAVLKNLVPINVRRIRDPQIVQADGLYLWGAFPLGVSQPYVIELDNPYVLTFYNLRWFALMRPILRWLLLRPQCRRIICISEACKQTLRRELGEAVANKAVVVYPFMRDYTQRERTPPTNQVRFLFVSTDFYRKGGRETLRAFARLAERFPEAHLTMVTNLPAEFETEYAEASWVTFVPANLDKAELFARYYDTADVFVLPTYQDSFGLVFLEAVAFGLPILSTRVYALPEMVRHGETGFLIEPPVHYFNADGRACPGLWDADAFIRSLAAAHYPETEEALYTALCQLMDADTRNRMATATRALYQQKFRKELRDAAFLQAVESLLAQG